MNAPVCNLTAEWRRIELLLACVSASRQGGDPPDAALGELAGLAGDIERVRAAGAWEDLAGIPLEARECDVVAAVLAQAVSPRVAAMVAALSAPGTVHGGGMTPALIGELYALEHDEMPDLARVTHPSAPLRAAGLLTSHADGSAWLAPLQPASWLVERALGLPDAVPAPPGSIRVAGHAVVDDLVLPADTRRRLVEFVTAARNRARPEEWGGRAAGGPVAMFAGPSGVGKSFAARAVAGELGWPLFRVDLGGLVSKYIGETEKNLSRLFDSAHGRGLVLHFDEAESIFGRRGEIREARDRYANLEVSHLLARLEAHDGPCILSTNLRKNLDPAFIRRFAAVVDFPRPTRPMREELWRRLLPPKAPLARDVDPALLSAVEMTGGEIGNAAAYACMLAEADGDGQPLVTLAGIALAVWRELGKDGRPLQPSDLGPLAAHLDESVRADAEASP